MTAAIELICFGVERSIEEFIQYKPLVFFESVTECAGYIQSKPKTATIFFITVAPSADEILKDTHNLRQLDSIFICISADREEGEAMTEELLEKYSKVIGVFSEYADLWKSIEENMVLSAQQNESFKFYEQRQKFARELSKEAGSFFWLRLFKDVVLQLPHHNQAKQEMIDQLKEYYRNNNRQLKWIEKFNGEYKSEDAIRWYTREPFLYKQLNRALRTEDVDLLHRFRYFIADLSKRLLEEFQILRESFSSTIHFYRGVTLSNQEIERIRTNVGRLISTNGYLSTSLSKDVALSYTDTTKIDEERSVLFDIEYDFGKIDAIVIAHIAEYSQHPQEDEVLFDLDAAFQLNAVEMDQQLKLIVVRMSVSDEGTPIVHDHLEEIGKDIQASSAQLVFGRLLAQIGQYEKSQRYFDRLLKNPGDEDPSFIYYYMGAAQFYQGKYDKALEYYGIATEMMNSGTKSRSFALSFVFNDLGVIYKTLGQYDQALDYLRRCLEIRQHHAEYPVIASCFENLAAVYRVKGDYDEALKLYRECLQIREKYLPKEHRQIAKTISNIGVIFRQQDRLSTALEHHQRSLSMSQKSLPPEHEDIALYLNRIGHVLNDQGKFREALDYYLRSLKMNEYLFPHGHLKTTSTLSAIGHIYYSLKDYCTSLKYLTKGLSIREMYFRDIKDEGLANIFTYLGLVFTKLHEDGNALVNYKRALQCAESIYPVGHTKLTECLTNMGISYRQMKEYRQAFEYFRRASENEEINTHRSNPINLARIYDNMGICLCDQNDEDQGLAHRMKAVRIIATVFPRGQYADWIDSVGDILFIRDDLDLALECYLYSLAIRAQCRSNDPLAMAQTFSNIAGVYAAMKKSPTTADHPRYAIKARFYYESALAVYQQLKHPSAADVLYSLGSLYESMKRYQHALNYYQQGLALCHGDSSLEHTDRQTFSETISRMKWLLIE